MPAASQSERPDEETGLQEPAYSWDWDDLWPIMGGLEADLAPRMPVLCTPAVAVPEHVITQAETLALAARLHADHPKLRLVLRLIENTGVAKRHLIRPIEDTLRHTGFGHRNQVFEEQAKKRIPAVVQDALDNAGLAASDIGAIVLVSCTGFMMPSLTAWMINELGFGADTAQLDFHVIHTGGPRVLDALRSHGGVPAEALGDSWETLTNHGNIASAAVFDVLRRVAEKSPAESAAGIIAGFGPGITMELALGTWVTDRAGTLAPAERKDSLAHGVR